MIIGFTGSLLDSHLHLSSRESPARPLLPVKAEETRTPPSHPHKPSTQGRRRTPWPPGARDSPADCEKNWKYLCLPTNNHCICKYKAPSIVFTSMAFVICPYPERLSYLCHLAEGSGASELPPSPSSPPDSAIGSSPRQSDYSPLCWLPVLTWARRTPRAVTQ